MCASSGPRPVHRRARSGAARRLAPAREPRATGARSRHERGSPACLQVISGERACRRSGSRATTRPEPEAHAGFKRFVAIVGPPSGLAWPIALHQGSGSPRRGSVRFTRSSLAVPRARPPLRGRDRASGRLGEAVATAAGSRRARSWRLLPVPRLPAVLRGVGHGARRRGSPPSSPRRSASHNAIAQSDPADPERVVVNKRAPAGSGSRGLGLHAARATAHRVTRAGCAQRRPVALPHGRLRSSRGWRARSQIVVAPHPRGSAPRAPRRRDAVIAEHTVGRRHRSAPDEASLKRRARVPRRTACCAATDLGCARAADSTPSARARSPEELAPGSPRPSARPRTGPTCPQHGLDPRRQGAARRRTQGLGGEPTARSSTTCAPRPTPSWWARAPCATERYGRATRRRAARQARGGGPRPRPADGDRERPPRPAARPAAAPGARASAW